METNSLIAHLQGKEKEIAELTSKLVTFFENEKVNAPLAIGCLAETASRLTSYLIKDLEDANAVRSLAEQMAGIFVHAIALPTETLLHEKFNETLLTNEETTARDLAID